MTQTVSNRTFMLAKIKIAQKQLAMDDDVYRAVLLRVTGKKSCADMSLEELDLVLTEMRRLGFMPKPKKSSLGYTPKRRQSADAMLKKVEALLLDNGWSWNYAHGMAKRMFSVDRVQWLPHDKLHKLVAALQIHANRLKEREGEHG